MRILYKLILLEEVLNCSLFAPHLVFKNLNLGLQLDIFFFVSVCDLFELKHFFLELFRKFQAGSKLTTVNSVHRGPCTYLRFVLSADLGTIALLLCDAELRWVLL